MPTFGGAKDLETLAPTAQIISATEWPPLNVYEHFDVAVRIVQ